MPSGLTSRQLRPSPSVTARPAGLALDCVSSPTGTGAVPVPSNPDGSTAGVKITAPDLVATRCDSAPANPVVPPHATSAFDADTRDPPDWCVTTPGSPLHCGGGLA